MTSTPIFESIIASRIDRMINRAAESIAASRDNSPTELRDELRMIAEFDDLDAAAIIDDFSPILDDDDEFDDLMNDAMHAMRAFLNDFDLDFIIDNSTDDASRIIILQSIAHELMIARALFS